MARQRPSSTAAPSPSTTSSTRQAGSRSEEGPGLGGAPSRSPSGPNALGASSAPTASVGVPAGTNVVVLRGTLSRDADWRTLPSGDQVVSCDVTVAAAGGGQRAESVPVSWFDPPARAFALAAGDEVVVVGRVRRRFFRAGGVTASRTEVVAHRVVPARSRSRVRTALDSVLSVLEPEP